ncbi:thermonuclease family protein [Candidatus Tokpelaia sp.]|nr:thermonuclease family protein [Candidatus Tokpelaia sp.]
MPFKPDNSAKWQLNAGAPAFTRGKNLRIIMAPNNKGKKFVATDILIIIMVLAASALLIVKNRQRAAHEPVWAEPAAIQLLEGYAEIEDGDSLKIKGQRLRLVGLDAPELKQYCYIEDKTYACGRIAADYLRRLVNKRRVRCQWAEKDKYQRLLGHCFAGDSDLNRQMVVAGWAVNYSSPGDGANNYKKEEYQARLDKHGLWQGHFKRPKDWRKQHPRL